jgi:hypothetical protein
MGVLCMHLGAVDDLGCIQMGGSVSGSGASVLFCTTSDSFQLFTLMFLLSIDVLRQNDVDFRTWFGFHILLLEGQVRDGKV